MMKKDIRELIAGILKTKAIPRMAENSQNALEEIANRCPSLVVLDIWLKNSQLDGLEILENLQQNYPDLPVVIIGGHGNIDTAVSAIKMGLMIILKSHLIRIACCMSSSGRSKASNLRRENVELQRKTWQFDLVGKTPIIEKLRSTIDKTAPTNSRVFINGPAGSGKELVARMIHKKSTRASQPFVAVNAAILEPENMENVLFGQIEEVMFILACWKKRMARSVY